MEKLAKLLARNDVLLKEMRALADKETLTDEEKASYDAKEAEFDNNETEIVRLQKLADLEARAADPVNTPVYAQPRNDEPLKLFKNFGEQLKVVKQAVTSGVVDDRLNMLNKEFRNAAAGMSVGVGEDGGFAVQTDFAGFIMESAAKAGNILPLVDQYTVGAGANGVRWVDTEEESVANHVFGGVQVYWAAEAQSVAKSQPKLTEKELKLEKLMGIAYATYELEGDTSFISQLYTKAFTLGIQRKLEEAIINGTGVGQPLGILRSGSKVAVAKEAGQAGGTVVWENLSKMYNRVLDKDRMGSHVWLAHPDLAEQFDFLHFPIGTGGVPVYLPAAQQGAVTTLKGKPVIETDQCSATGTEGDIICTDLSEYFLIRKGGVQTDTSIHVQFLTAENAFRFIFRANGMPKRQKPLTIKNSSNQRSHIITLATRA